MTRARLWREGAVVGLNAAEDGSSVPKSDDDRELTRERPTKEGSGLGERDSPLPTLRVIGFVGAIASNSYVASNSIA